MKKILCVVLMAALASCEYHDLRLPDCYVASEQTSAGYITYTYNSQNQLVSYSAPNITSSTLAYNDAGKIVSEFDNKIFAIAYSYDNKNRLIQWSETIESSPGNNVTIKFFYNSFDQDTLQQFYRYNLSTADYYLWRYARREFANLKNYSRVRTFDAATNTLLYTEDFLWDNHPNPYLANAFFLNAPPATNNMTRYTFTIAGNTPQTTDFAYSYNSNRFPIEKRVLPYNAIVTLYTYTNCQ